MSIPLPPLPRLFSSDKLQHATEIAILTARDQEIVATVLAAAAKVLTEHQIPVGNSAAGEIACEMTYDALKECRDNIKSLEFTHHE